MGNCESQIPQRRAELLAATPERFFEALAAYAQAEYRCYPRYPAFCHSDNQRESIAWAQLRDQASICRSAKQPDTVKACEELEQRVRTALWNRTSAIEHLL